MSKLSKMFFGRQIISSGSVLFINKYAKMPEPTTNIYLGGPFATSFVDTLVSILCPRKLSAILHLLRPRTLPKILFPVVKSVVAYMVNLFALATVKDVLVHQLVHPSLFFRFVSSSIEALGIRCPSSHPVKLRKVLEIIGIDNRVFPLCEGDKSVGFVKGLSNGMALHSVMKSARSWHFPTPIGICCSASDFSISL